MAARLVELCETQPQTLVAEKCRSVLKIGWIASVVAMRTVSPAIRERFVGFNGEDRSFRIFELALENF